MLIVQRFFHQNLPDDNQNTGETQPFSSYADKHMVVILGGSGIGKSTELEQAAKSDADSLCCTVSQFLTGSLEQYQDKTIFMDALDEHRAELHQGKPIIDGIRGRLKELGSPKVRISCRSEEWHHGSDVQSLSDVTRGEPLYILRMDPLRSEDILAIADEIIDDADVFMEGARERQLEESLGNPETLNLYLSVYKNGGGWPKTRSELMEKSTELLLSEENETHERARAGSISDDRLIRAAEDLSAILLLGDMEGVALSRAAGTTTYIPIQELSEIDQDAAQVAARRRLFSSNASELASPQHKTTGDYLTAKALARRIGEQSLPLGRVLSLLTGTDGGPLSHMRDIYAWLIALLPNQAEHLIKADPFGALIYGDVRQWTDNTCRTALNILSDYAANNDPWFRSEDWFAPLLAGLARPALVENFRDILKNEPSPHVTSVVISALEFGKPMPEIGSDLIAFIYDQDHPHHEWLKDDALRAYCRICPGSIEVRKKLLEDIQTESIKDEDHMLRAALLSEFYPTTIGPSQIVRYLACSDIVGTGTMGWFIRHDLVEKTPDDELPTLVNAILSTPNEVEKLGDFDRRQLNGALILRLLNAHGDTAKAEEIYTWLGVYLDKRFVTHIDEEDSDAIRIYLKSHPKLYVNLFRYWLDKTVPDETQNYRYHYTDFRNLLLLVVSPNIFPKFLLNWASEETNSEKANFLFDVALEIIVNGELEEFGVDLESLCDFVERNPSFEEIWEKRRFMEISEWRQKSALRKQNYRKGREGIRARDIEILTDRIDDLKTGRDIPNLEFGAEIWFNLSREGKNEKSPIERLRQRTNGEITEALLEGFEALLQTVQPLTPTEIATLQCENKHYNVSYPILAGADYLAARSKNTFLALPKNNLKAALAYHFIVTLGNESRTWD